MLPPVLLLLTAFVADSRQATLTKPIALGADAQDQALCASLNFSNKDAFREQLEKLSPTQIAHCLWKMGKRAGGGSGDSGGPQMQGQMPWGMPAMQNMARQIPGADASAYAHAAKKPRDFEDIPTAEQDPKTGLYKIKTLNKRYVLGNPAGSGYGFMYDPESGDAYVGQFNRIHPDGEGYEFKTVGGKQEVWKVYYDKGILRTAAAGTDPGYYAATNRIYELYRIMNNLALQQPASERYLGPSFK